MQGGIEHKHRRGERKGGREKERESERGRVQERYASFIGINQEGREEEGLWRDYRTCQSSPH